MAIKIEFLGAARTVTGSKYLVHAHGKKILVDSGTFQGKREQTQLNWIAPTFEPRDIDAVLLTHAHIDHTGMLPRYYQQGLKCPVFCTAATKSLCNILLPDTGRLEEQEAEYRRQRGKSRFPNPLPLYTEATALQATKLLTSVPFNKLVNITDTITATWHQAGHILGAGIINLNIGTTRLTFSGDLGRYGVPILNDPVAVELGSTLLIESTYAGRYHPDNDVRTSLATIINSVYSNRGVLVIPSFAVGRAQLLLYYLRELKETNLIPDIPVYVDSPMAIDGTEVYRQHPECYDQDLLNLNNSNQSPFHFRNLFFTRTVSESIALNSVNEPMIVIAGSGMVSGGRVLHHLKHRLPQPQNVVLFVGHQPQGGRGWQMQNGFESIHIFGKYYPLRAKIETISGLSAHADHSELLRWCKACTGKPSQVATVHGEEESCIEFANHLKDSLNWNATAPKIRDIIEC
jgi:metallo-beta-lactamase family protein